MLITLPTAITVSAIPRSTCRRNVLLQIGLRRRKPVDKPGPARLPDTEPCQRSRRGGQTLRPASSLTVAPGLFFSRMYYGFRKPSDGSPFLSNQFGSRTDVDTRSTPTRPGHRRSPGLFPVRHRRQSPFPGVIPRMPGHTAPAKHFHHLLSVVYITDAGRVASDFFSGPKTRKAGTVARLTPMSARVPLQKTKRAEICSCRAPYRPLVEVDDVGVRNVGLGTRQPFVPVATDDAHPAAPTLT